MSDAPIEHGEFISIESYVLEQEIKAVTDQLPNGSLERGFLLRYLPRFPPSDAQPSRDEWTREMYMSEQGAAELLAQWHRALEATGRKFEFSTKTQH